jgi:hypothetical protein
MTANALAVTNAKLAANAVQTGNILDGTIGNADLGPNAVTGDKVQNGSLAAADLGVLVGTVSVDPPSLNAGECSIASATVTGMQSNDRVILNHADTALDAGLVTQPMTGAADTLRVRVCNTTAGTVDGASHSYSYIVIR